MSDAFGSQNGLQHDPYASREVRDASFFLRLNQRRHELRGLRSSQESPLGPVHWILLFGAVFLLALLLARAWPRVNVDQIVIAPHATVQNFGGVWQGGNAPSPVRSMAYGRDAAFGHAGDHGPVRPSDPPRLSALMIHRMMAPSPLLKESEWLGIAPRQKHGRIIDGSCANFPGDLIIEAFVESDDHGAEALGAASTYANRVGWKAFPSTPMDFSAAPFVHEGRAGFTLTGHLACEDAAALKSATLTMPGAANQDGNGEGDVAFAMPEFLRITGPSGTLLIPSDLSKDGVFRFTHQRDRGWVRVHWFEWDAPIDPKGLTDDLASLLEDRTVTQGS
jgi:hypothetical protein